MLMTITIIDSIDNYDPDVTKAKTAVNFISYAANVSIPEAITMLEENISWLINTDKSVDDLRAYAKDHCSGLDVAIVPAEINAPTFCSFCDREATDMVEESNMPLCAACKEAFEYGQSRSEYTVVEV